MSGGGRVWVLGVRVDRLSVEGLHAEVARLARRRGGTVLNANAHCLNICHGDEELRRFFAGADVVFCDGAGVRLAARMLGRSLPERITYADWLPRLSALAEERGLSLFFLGARPGVAAEAARRLRGAHPNLRIAGVRHGFFDHGSGSPENGEVVAEINAARPDILNHHRLDVRVALTGGAVFDYASGRLRRGPRLLTDNGFEWLARLLVEPSRLWRRYLLGNPLFLARVLAQRLREGAATRKREEM